MDKEYIERDAAVAFLENMAASRYLIQCFENKERFPTADVAPVVRGEWETVYSDQLYQCSNCKKTSEPTDFCPHCGADMRGVHQ